MTLFELKQTMKPLEFRVSDGDNFKSVLYQIYKEDLTGYSRQLLARLNSRYDLDNLLPGSVFYYYPLQTLQQLTDIV